MSDDLDAFFSKKDNRKKKGKTAIKAADFSTEHERIQKKREKREAAEREAIKKITQEDEDAEWVDFQSDDKDYSQLKINNLAINVPPEELEDEEEKVEEEPETPVEIIPITEPPAVNAWERKKLPNEDEGDSDSDESLKKADSKSSEPTPPPEPPKPAVSNKYVPPALRGKPEGYAPPSLDERGGSLVPSALPMGRPKKSKAAPNIADVESFPSLDAAFSKKEESPAVAVGGGAWKASSTTTAPGSQQQRPSTQLPTSNYYDNLR